MATEDTARQIGAKIAAARKRVPVAMKRLVLEQSRKERDEGRRALAALDKDLEEAVKLLGSSTPPPPSPDPDGPDVPSGWQTVANKTFSGAEVARELDGPFKNRAYANCIFQDYSGESILHGKLGSGIQFHNCTFRKMKATKETHGTLLIYPGDSAGTSRDNYGLKFVNCTFEECEGSDIFEIKCSGVEIINCRFVRCKGGIRVRHGVGTKIINCMGVTDITLRCGPHVVVNCPDAVVIAYAGNLPGEADKWPPLHEAGGGHNMQCAYACQIANVKSIELGYHFGDNDRQYPATECVIAPAMRGKTKVITEKGTRWEEVSA
jgi:hypothetical protein